MPDKENAEVKKIKCVVKVDNHTHAGKRCKKGDPIFLGSQKKVDALRERGIVA